MASTPFADAAFDHIVSNETTMYVDLPEAFAEFSRLLRPGGRYALVTWCSTGTTAGTAPEVDAINQHYVCKIHPRSHYLQALLASNLIPIQVTDLTSQALPYWELRASSRMATGVEPHFLNAYQAGNMNYLVIVAERKP
jgi:geranyl diphosphate 2-C-methyltransferase